MSLLSVMKLVEFLKEKYPKHKKKFTKYRVYYWLYHGVLDQDAMLIFKGENNNTYKIKKSFFNNFDIEDLFEKEEQIKEEERQITIKDIAIDLNLTPFFIFKHIKEFPFLKKVKGSERKYSVNRLKFKEYKKENGINE